MYGHRKPKEGPELVSMKLNKFAKRAVATHEAGHYLVGYLLNKKGLYHRKPAMVTIIGRYSYLGRVNFQSDEKYDPAISPLYNERSGLVIALAGKAAEEVFFGEENVHTGAFKDLKRARSIARSIGKALSQI